MEELVLRVGELVGQHWPGARVVSVRPVGADAAHDPTFKGEGYGRPLHLVARLPGGEERDLVLRTATPNEFGHDRRADRAEAMVLDYDTFGLLPRHVRALDLGVVGPQGRLVSLRGAGEFFVLTTWAPGSLYADDLRRIAREGALRGGDPARAAALCRYLVALHARPPPGAGPAAYTRAVRDLVGHGEGVFGIVDGYPPGTPGAPPERLAALERRCLEWRWRLRGRHHRLRRTHGDFHPFNIVFAQGEDFTLLDASRGCVGDPADDVAALVLNYVFFAFEQPGAWAGALGRLWRLFWGVYLEESGDRELLEVVAPFLAWRALVVACPRFYPALPASAREALLGWVERALATPRFEPASAHALFP